MIVGTVLSLKPYSGVYTACNNCTGKVLPHQSSEWWCRKCQCVIARVHCRYCVAMTITDHSTSPQGVLMFGGSCDPIFGCSAANLARCLDTVQRESINQVLYSAIESTLVGNCFGFVFCLPQSIKKQDTLLNIVKLLKDCNVKKRELVATTIKMLSNNSSTVLHRLEPNSVNRPPLPPGSDPPWQLSETPDVSDFSFGTQVSTTPSQALLLETYVDSQETSSGLTVVTPLSSSSLDLSTSTQCSNQMPSSHLELSSIKKSISHDKVALSQEVTQDYVSELDRTNWLVDELESDWLSTQQNSTPFIIQQNPISLSEDTLKELQEPFSQSRQSTPTATGDSSLLASTSPPLTDRPPSQMSPELFSSVHSTRTAGSNHPSHPYTPSLQLLQRTRDNASPELFESLPRNCLNTPATGLAKGRIHALRRKLVKDTTSINVTPCTFIPSQIVNNAFSPDIL